MTSNNEGSRAKSLPLVGGALALDFVNTASGRGGPLHLDHLLALDDLFDWATHAGVAVDAGTVTPEAGTTLSLATGFRERINGIADAILAGHTPSPDDLAQLKTQVADAIAVSRLERGPDGGFAWTLLPGTPALDAILAGIALSALALLREADLTRLKRCPGEGCGWLFLDQTKNRSRRWCEMAVCGNRSKARRFRSGQAIAL